MALRRAVAEELRSLKGASDDFDGDTVDERARERVVEYKRASFKKMPDAPLAVVIGRKQKNRVVRQEGPTTAPEWTEIVEALHSEKRLLREIKRRSK